MNLVVIFKFKRTSSPVMRNLRQPSLVSYVDVFYGTGTISGSSLSTGNLFPVVALPHGFNHWTIATRGTSPWFFDPNSHSFKGIRCTHQPSPWIGDYAYFDIRNPHDEYWDKDLSTITPSFMKIVGKSSTMSLVPTNTGAVLKVSGVKTIKFDGISDWKRVGKYKMVGTVKRSSIFHTPTHTVLHVVAMSSVPWDSGELDVIRIGTSFISESQALENMPTDNFELLVKTNDRIWDGMLGKIKVYGRGPIEKFYTMLYRALLFPRQLVEPNWMHYSPYDRAGGIFEGPLSTDSGFWDAYRTVYPLLHLAFPDIAKMTLDGWVNSIKEDPNGKLAQWASPGKVDSMEGSMGEITIAEGILNDAITDVDAAWGYLRRSCFESDGGRESFDLYLRYGYVPGQVSLSLNYYLSDYVVSLAAQKLGYHEEAVTLLHRSRNWNKLFDYDNKFFRPKNSKGSFQGKFDQYEWMGPYREGGPWQYRFYVPHDPDGLNSIGYGGMMCKYLNEMMTGSNKVSNRNKIHEETEMQRHSFGQYSHNNQPVHHVMYLFAHAGCASSGQRWIRHVLNTQYTDSGFSGDEDNGEMSAWFILSSMGLYSLVPGSGKYQVGAPPLFDDIYLEERGIRITNKYGVDNWQSVEINGELITGDLVQIDLRDIDNSLIRF